MKQRPVPARSTVVLMAGALLAAALIAPVAAKESPKELKQSYKYVVGKLSKNGTINAPKNPLNWTKLMNVPSGIADGTDDGITSVDGCVEGSFIQDIASDGTATCGTPQAGGGGDITGVTAGTGLTGGGTTGDVGLAVNDATFQRRLTGSCANVRQEITGVAVDGTVQCGFEPYPVAQFDTDQIQTTELFTSTTFTALPLAGVDVLTFGQAGVILNITFSAESACSGGVGSQWCSVRILVDGVEAAPAGGTTFGFDSTDNGTETASSWESHSMTRSYINLSHSGATPLAITVEVKVSNASTSFRLNYWNLSVSGSLF